MTLFYPKIRHSKKTTLYSTLTHRQYTQGMSDLASPLLMMFDDEALCFWTFVGLMEQHKYISSPKDDDIRKELILLRRLIKLLLPKFYKHILNMGPGAQDLLFAHRWLLLLCVQKNWSFLRFWSEIFGQKIDFLKLLFRLVLWGNFEKSFFFGRKYFFLNFF